MAKKTAAKPATAKKAVKKTKKSTPATPKGFVILSEVAELFRLPPTLKSE